ncbi:MAG: aldehyde dehydrogenase family protein [Acidimicrobiia bacterium]
MTSTANLAAPSPAGRGAGVVRRLRATFESGRTRDLAWRLHQLDQVGRLLRDAEEEIVEALAADLGRPRFEAWLGDLRTTARDAAHIRRNLRRWVADVKVRPPLPLLGTRPRIVREPLGVVLVIAPWNYPVHLAVSPMVAALAAGNVAVVKPSELTPHASGVLARLLPEYLDPDAVAVVEGGVEATQDLLRERFDHVFYTGNGRVGREVMAAAAAHLTPVTLELGGKSPVVVDRDADLVAAAERIVFAKMLNAGQSCVAPDYVLVHRDVEQGLLDGLTAAIRDRYGIVPAASAELGRIVSDRHVERLAGLLDGGGYEAVECGGEVDRAQRYVAPTVLSGVRLDAPVMAEEIFGPILPVVAVDDIDEALAVVRAGDKPLALYVFSRSAATVERVLAATSSGAVGVNDAATHMLVEHLPFGGVGASGMGAYHGRWGVETFSHRKAVLERPGWMKGPLSPPYGPVMQKVLRKVL